MKSPQSAASSDAWNTYWEGDKQGHAYSDQGLSQPAIAEFWKQQLAESFEKQDSISMVDLACGNGAISQLARTLNTSTRLEQTCVDVSSAALRNVATLLPGIATVESNISNLSLPHASFDLVVSQFGLEYAGESALPHALDLVSPGGTVILIMHMQGGVIELECQTNLNAIDHVIAADFIPATHTFLESAYSILQQQLSASDEAHKDAKSAFVNSLQGIEKALEQYGTHVCAGTIHKLYNDVANIVQNIKKYDFTEVSNWLTSMNHELNSYRIRMQTMVGAALSAEQFNTFIESAKNRSFDVTVAGPLIDTESQQPLAWAFTATAS